VVERPSSVVKELLENSIDAKAKRIQIDIENGGSFLIRIRDDGTGISKEDLPFALARHATSKIYTQDDLYQIASLGFRGEALASIASVSRLIMTSKHQDADDAWQIKVEGKDLTPIIEPAAHPNGTTIEVANLFYNVPARRKFLRSARTEFIHIEEVVRRLALANFNIGFTLKHNDKVILNLNPIEDISLAETRLAKMFDMSFVDHAMYFERDNYDMKLRGWFVNSTISRSQNDQQYFYINGRIIRDKVINHAIRQAWQQYFPEGRYPSYVIFLDIPYSELDVNVHPTKHEVRFKQSRLVHDFVHQVIAQILRDGGDTGKVIANDNFQTSNNDFDNFEEFVPTQPIHQTQSSHTKTPAFQSQAYYEYERELPTVSEIKEQQSYYNAIEKPTTVTIHLQQRFGNYCLVLIDNEYYFVNLLCALNHKISELMTANEKKSPPLLLPISVNVEKSILHQLENWHTQLEMCGIDYSMISESCVAIRALPKLLNYIDWDNCFAAFCHVADDVNNEKFNNILSKHIQLPEDNAQIHQLLQNIATDFELLKSKGHIKLLDENLIEELF